VFSTGASYIVVATVAKTALSRGLPRPLSLLILSRGIPSAAHRNPAQASPTMISDNQITVLAMSQSVGPDRRRRIIRSKVRRSSRFVVFPDEFTKLSGFSQYPDATVDECTKLISLPGTEDHVHILRRNDVRCVVKFDVIVIEPRVLQMHFGAAQASG